MNQRKHKFYLDGNLLTRGGPSIWRAQHLRLIKTKCSCTLTHTIKWGKGGECLLFTVWIIYCPSSNMSTENWHITVQKISDYNFPTCCGGSLWGSHFMVIPYVNIDKWFGDNNVGFYRVKPYNHFVQHSIAVVGRGSWNPTEKFSAQRVPWSRFRCFVRNIKGADFTSIHASKTPFPSNV